jgi:rhamnosyltransferase
LNETINYILAEGINLILVDNGDFDNSIYNRDGINYIPLKNNYGIAYAINIGIKNAFLNNYDNILLLDQDSILDKNYFDLLKDVELKDECIYLSSHFDRKTKFEFKPVSINRYGFKTSTDKRISFSMSTGTFFNKKIINKIGFFNEKLFIDYVDTEWFLRANSFGINLIQIKPLIIYHQLGEDYFKLLNYKVFIHKPFRLFYRVRNLNLLIFTKHMPFFYILIEHIKALLYLILIFFYSSERIKYLKFYFKSFKPL